MGTPKGRRKKGRNGRNILNSMTENIPKLTKSQTGMFRKSITNTKKSMPMHIIVKVHAIKDREKNFKPEGKFFIYSQSNKNRNYTELLRKPCKEEVSGVKYIVLNFFFKSKTLPSKVILKSRGNKYFVRQALREFVTGRSAQQEMLKTFFRKKGNEVGLELGSI